MTTGFLLAEDAALKARFSGITVNDDRNNMRPVQVFFRYPEGETERLYPFITIEMIDIVHARNRQHSEVYLDYVETGKPNRANVLKQPNALKYWPSQGANMDGYVEDATADGLVAGEFVPVDILYQVSTFTRSALHDRQLSSQMLSTIVPFRKGFIDIPADGTIRRLDLLDWTTADLLDPEAGYRKRIFRKIYTLQMSAEIPSTDLHETHQITSTNVTLTVNDNTP